MADPLLSKLVALGVLTEERASEVGSDREAPGSGVRGENLDTNPAVAVGEREAPVCEGCGSAPPVIGCQTIHDDAMRSLCKACHAAALLAVGAIPDGSERVVIA